MQTYLEALEKLGKLLDAGVLTKEEFETEKARLLQARPASPEIEEPRRRLPLYVAIGSVVALLISGSIAYAIFKNIGEDSHLTQANQTSAVSTQTRTASHEQDLSITFADASKCEPGPSLSDLLTKIEDGASSEPGSDLRLVRLAGSPGPIEVNSAVRNFGERQVKLGSLQVSQVWQGLKLDEVRTAEWDGGSGFQLRFVTSPEHLLRVAKAAGFKIEVLDKPSTNEGYFAAIEKSPGRALLTCMKSNTTDQETTSDASVNETGE